MNVRTRRLSRVVVTAGVLAVVIAQFALAYWTNNGPGSGAASTASVPAGIAPSASAAGTTVTVNVTQVSVAGQFVGAIGGGYTVKRYPASGGSSVTPGGTCGSLLSGASAVLSCTETGTPRGDWRYTARPVLYGWTGTESTTSSTVIVTPDPPSALTATAAPAAAINLTWSAGAGATGYNVYRRTTAGSYNFGAPLNGATPASGTSFSDTAAISGTAYNYVVRGVVIGSAGQQIESASSNEPAAVTADGGVPTGVTLDAVATPMRGSITLSGAASDAISGVAGITFQIKPTSGSTWSTACSDNTSPYSCSFNSASVSDGLYDFRALATDNAGNTATSTAQTSRRIDNTAPAATANNPGSFVRGTITLGGTASDAGSGLTLLELQGQAVGGGGFGAVCTSATSPLSCSYDTTPLADGSYEIRLAATDAAGNQGISSVVTPIVVDNTAPTVTMTSPGANIRSAVTLASTTSDATSGIGSVQYQYKPSAGSTWTNACNSTTNPFSCSFTTTSLTDGLYDFRATATDRSGNATTSATVAGIRVDNTAPTGVTITAPAANLRGTVTVAAGTPTDTGSGVASVGIQVSPAGAGSWTTACSDATAPYSCGVDTTAFGDGLYDFRALATDNAGNTAASTASTNRRIDNTAPSVSLTSPGTPIRATVTLNATSTDAGSGVASVAFDYKLSSGSTWTAISTDTSTPYSASFNTSALNGTYDIRATSTDNAGNTASSTVTNIVIDNTVPTAADVQIVNGTGTVGRPDAGDIVTYTFSEPMSPTSILAGWNGSSTSVTVRLNNNTTNDRLYIYNSANTTVANLGYIATGGNFVTANRTFTASTMTMSGNTITVTLGTASGAVSTVATNTTAVWNPVAGALDLAGNAMSTATRTETGTADPNF